MYLFKHYPKDTFRALWQNFSELVESGEIISSSEAKKELQALDDDIAKWSKENKVVFLKPTSEELNTVKQILKSHPELLKQKSINIGNPEADPFLIAQARSRNIPVVTIEQYKDGGHKIPNVCKDLKVKCLHLFAFFKEEGWRF
jgi:hypothetical protein